MCGDPLGEGVNVIIVDEKRYHHDHHPPPSCQPYLNPHRLMYMSHSLMMGDDSKKDNKIIKLKEEEACCCITCCPLRYVIIHLLSKADTRVTRAGHWKELKGNQNCVVDLPDKATL